MTTETTGGPAFPVHAGPNTVFSGLTIRDWFAGQALAGIIAGQSDLETNEVRNGVRAKGHEARTAYRYADAMLKARKEQP